MKNKNFCEYSQQFAFSFCASAFWLPAKIKETAAETKAAERAAVAEPVVVEPAATKQAPR